jgi:predicted AAA+ superfamily ATPase
VASLLAFGVLCGAAAQEPPVLAPGAAPPSAPAPDITAEAFAWHTGPDRLEAVHHVSRVDIALLVGIARVRDILLANTLQFARGLPANNALLWGARGMGKSSLVKAVHVSEGQDVKAGDNLAIVEAMKMENILKAERDGVVKKVNAKAGDSLAVDAVILEFA